MTIGEKIRAVRTEKGFSQRKLQEESGVERNFLSLVENNHRSPSFKTLMRIANALGVTVGYITDYNHSSPRDDVTNSNIFKMLHDFLNEDGSIDKNQFFPTPIVNEAGLNISSEDFNENHIEDYVFISSKFISPPVNTKRYRCLWIKEHEKAFPPLINTGALICVDSTQRNPSELEDEVVVFYDNQSGCVIRRLYFRGEHILGMSEKPMHQQPLVIPVSNKNAILGKVIWSWNKFIN